MTAKTIFECPHLVIEERSNGTCLIFTAEETILRRRSEIVEWLERPGTCECGKKHAENEKRRAARAKRVGKSFTAHKAPTDKALNKPDPKTWYSPRYTFDDWAEGRTSIHGKNTGRKHRITFEG